MRGEEQEVTCDATPQIAVLPKIRSVWDVTRTSGVAEDSECLGCDPQIAVLPKIRSIWDVTLFRRASNYRRFAAT